MLPGKVRRTEGLSGAREDIPATGSVGKKTLVDNVAATTPDVDESRGPGDGGPNVSPSDDAVTAEKGAPRMRHSTNDAVAVKRPRSRASHLRLDDSEAQAQGAQARDAGPLGTRGDPLSADVTTDRVGVPHAAGAERVTTSERQNGESSDSRVTSSAAAGSLSTPPARARAEGPLAGAVVSAGGDAAQNAAMRARSADADLARTPGTTTGEPQQAGDRGADAQATASGASQLGGDHSAGGPTNASGVQQLGAAGTTADSPTAMQHRGDHGAGGPKDASHTRPAADAHKAGPRDTAPATTAHASDAHEGDARLADAHPGTDHDAGAADAHVPEHFTAPHTAATTSSVRAVGFAETDVEQLVPVQPGEQ